MSGNFFIVFLIAIFFPVSNTHAYYSKLALTFDTNIRTINMSSSQEAKIQKAEETIRAIIASEEFRNRVLNHRYRGKKRFANNEGLTNLEIYEKILAGAEKLYPVENNTMDLEVKLYYEDSNTVGFTRSKSRDININKKFFNRYATNKVSRNIMHEWLHKLGFSHDVKATKSRSYSVPYAVGKIIEQLGKEME